MTRRVNKEKLSTVAFFLQYNITPYQSSSNNKPAVSFVTKYPNKRISRKQKLIAYGPQKQSCNPIYFLK